MLKTLLLGALVLAGADAAAHKQWMNDASDAQEDFRDAIAAKSGSKAADAAMKIDDLMGRTEAYWTEKKAADGVKLAHDSRAIAKEAAAAANAGRLEAANAAFTRLGATCNSCHELHLEKR
jgi:hypothetical protein